MKKELLRPKRVYLRNEAKRNKKKITESCGIPLFQKAGRARPFGTMRVLVRL